MAQTHKVSVATLTLYSMLSKIITPIALLLGVLILITYNFSSVLKTIEPQSDPYHGRVAFNQGALYAVFKENTGLDRPNIAYNGNEFLSYAEWSSTISVDGEMQELWNNYHGYSVDETHHQVYNTVSGNGWQLIEIATLVDDHTVTVTFNLVTRPQSTTPPSQYVLDIMHTHNFWYQEQISGGTFNAEVAEGDPANSQNSPQTYQPTTLGSVSLTVKNDGAQASSLRLSDVHTSIMPGGKLSWSQGLISEYKIANPPPFQMITLGTETLHFHAADATPEHPMSGPIPTT